MKDLIGSQRRADIVFHANGRIDIAARVAKILGLEEGDVVSIVEHTDEYYLYVAHKSTATGYRYEGRVWRSKKGSYNFRAQSVRLCKKISQLCGRKDVYLPCGNRCRIGECKNAVPIITLNALNRDA